MVLDLVNDVITKRRKQILKLDTLIKSRFVEMFGDPITNKHGWDRGTIREVVSDVKYGTSKPASENGKYPYLRMNNITYEGRLDISNLKYIDINDDEVEKYIVRKGDILFNRTNSKELVGKTCVFDLIEPMVIAGYIIRVRTNDLAIPSYISAVLNSDYGKLILKMMCKSIIGQANINAQELQDIKILIPPITLQTQFADFVHQVDKSKFVIKKSLDETQELFDCLMQKYFE
jgi:type I restriction enzyme S subunit